MVEQIPDFLIAGLQSLADAVAGLFWPAAFFLGLGLVVKGASLFADMRRAFGQTFLNVQIMALNILFFLPVIGLTVQLLSQSLVSSGLVLLSQETWSGLPVLLTIFFAIFIGDFTGYWRHRLEHTRLLWPSHAVHHSDTEMTWMTLQRFHPFNVFSTLIIDSVVLTLLGFPAYAIIANNLVRHYYGYFIHADLPWTYGPLAAVFVSPAMHRWHHAADSRFFNTNFATVFSVFDRAFGTYRVPGPCTSPLGVTDHIEPTLLGQLTYALSPRAYRGLLSRRAGDRKRAVAKDAPAGRQDGDEVAGTNLAP